MTNELLHEIENDYWNEKADPIDMAEVFDLAEFAIKALKQQPCEDCISREEVRKILANQRDELIKLHTVNPKDNPKADAMAYGVNWSLNTLMELPSVTSKQIDKIENSNYSEEQYKADLQGTYDCGYNCGYADAMNDIAEREGEE